MNSIWISGISALPTELINDIIQLSAASELPSLCRVSKKFNAVATRLLYHTLVLQSQQTAIRCFRTIAANESVALAVKSVELKISPYCELLFGFYRLAATAIKHATQLSVLDISGLELLLELLHDMPLTKLRECALPYTLSARRFLLNHLHVERLTVHSQGYFPEGNVAYSAASVPPVQLPQLTFFMGECTLAPRIIPGSSVQSVSLYWTKERELDVLASMASSKLSKPLTALDNCVPSWDYELIPAIAFHLPQLKRLSVYNLAKRNFMRGLPEMYASVESSLGSFEYLYALAIWPLYLSAHCTLGQLDQEYELVKRWGDLCPTLLVCSLPSGTRWKKICHHAWLPETKETKGSVKTVWAKKAVASVKFPLEAYIGILDVYGEEIVPQLQVLIAQGVQYPVLHIDLPGVTRTGKPDEIVHAWHQEITHEEDDKDEDGDGDGDRDGEEEEEDGDGDANMSDEDEGEEGDYDESDESGDGSM